MGPGTAQDPRRGSGRPADGLFWPCDDLRRLSGSHQRQDSRSGARDPGRDGTLRIASAVAAFELDRAAARFELERDRFCRRRDRNLGLRAGFLLLVGAEETTEPEHDNLLCLRVDLDDEGSRLDQLGLAEESSWTSFEEVELRRARFVDG